MAYNDRESFKQALEIFSSLYQDMAAPDLPPGLSPDCQDVQFLPGGVFTRAGLQKLFQNPPETNVDVVSLAEYPTPNGDFLTMFLYSDGKLFQQDLQSGIVSQVGSVAAGCQFKSTTAFGKQFYALYNPTLAAAFSNSPFAGADIPRYYDGQNLWRVTQDAPGANPTFTNILTSQINLAQSAPTGSVSITAALSTNPKTITINIPGYPGHPPSTETITYYTAIIYTCTAPVSASWVGLRISVSGITGTNSNLVNVTGTVTAVVGSTFTIATVATGTTLVNLSGQAGTGSITGNYFARANNIVTVYLGSSVPQYFSKGMYAKVGLSAGGALNGPNWTIDATGGIARDTTGLVTVTIDTQLTNLTAGSVVYIAATDTTDFPQSYRTVYQVISATGGKTVFTISDPTWGNGAVVSSNTGGSVYQTWSGVFQLQSVGLDTNGNAFATYFQLGPDTVLSSISGTATIQLQSQVASGPRNAVMMFKSVNGALTGPSIPIQVAAVGGTNLFAAQDIPIGPLGTAQRVIAFTPAFGSSYFYVAPVIVPSAGGLPPVLSLGTIINDNTSTAAILDFSDTQLTASVGATQIDVQGNNLFNQIRLAPCLGCVEYEGRLCWWGEINDIKNLLNMGFDGGYQTSSASGLAGSGANSGAGTAWTSPGNIGSTSTASYAAVTVGIGSSQELQAETYPFALPATASPGVITVTMNATWTAGISNAQLVLQLLKAGVPTGAIATVQIFGSAGSTSAPVQIQATFSGAALLPSDINGATFGVQMQLTSQGGSTTISLNSCTLNIAYGILFPLAWQSTGSTGGVGTLIANGTLGFSYQMVGAGGVLDCLITQPVYKDFYGGTIVQPSTAYYFRFLGSVTGATSGSFVCDIYSPTFGVMAQVLKPIANFATSLSWITLSLPALPAYLPADIQLRVYLINSTSTVTVDELELISQQFPVNFQQMRVSYFLNPFGYDLVTGILQVQGRWKITGAFTQRNYIYALTDGPMSQGQNNGQTEPNGWAFDKFADECDCFGPNAVIFTEDLAWWAGQIAGVRIFNGSKPAKISQEIQNEWELINDALPLSIYLANDSEERCLYCGIPSGASATKVNRLLPMSYRNVGDIANDPAPLRQSLSGKMIPLELCRKWTRWTPPLQCGAEIMQGSAVGNERQIFFGGATFGNLYSLNSTKTSDDDYGTIPSYYVTCFFFNHETEQGVPLLGLHRKIFDFLSLYISGVGQVQVTPYVDNLSNPWSLTPTVWNALTNSWSAGGPGTFQGTCNTSGLTVTLVSGGPDFPANTTQIIIGGNYFNVTAQSVGQLTLATSPGTLNGIAFTSLYTPAAITALPPYNLSAVPTHDLEWPMNVTGERMALKIAVIPQQGLTAAAFNLQHLVVSGRADRVFQVRGAVV